MFSKYANSNVISGLLQIKLDLTFKIKFLSNFVKLTKPKLIKVFIILHAFIDSQLGKMDIDFNSYKTIKLNTFSVSKMYHLMYILDKMFIYNMNSIY